jgi:hypothetical protein
MDRRLVRALALGIATGLFGSAAAPADAASPVKPPTSAQEAERMQRIEDHMRALQEELATMKQGREVDAAKVEEVESELHTLQDLFARVKVGGYGSVRYEANDLQNEKSTFTFRRMVLTTEAQINEHMRFYTEIEYERFRQLELERTVTPTDGGLQVEQAFEGTNGSEISVEQAWLEYAIDPRLRLRAGGVLVPIGRFNLDHDDNQWDLTRRTLVDRGTPVIPIKAAWDELGVGFNGDFQVGEGNLGYQLYVVNGATIDVELEEIAQTRNPDTNKLELEAKFSPQTGTFSNDVKNAKAVAGRLAWTPETGQELAFSFYTGRYTPDYLANQRVSSFALDGLTSFLGFELEGELVTTRWSGIRSVAKSFAERSFNQKGAIEDTTPGANLETEVEFELANLAKQKTGYWLELRYPFWPEFLPTFGFAHPQLIPVGRFEQVWFDDLLTEAGFSNGVLDEFDTRDARLSRGTVGLAYRPTPLVVFSAAYEYTWAHRGSLVGLTNFLNATPSEGHANAFTMGVAFGF